MQIETDDDPKLVFVLVCNSQNERGLRIVGGLNPELLWGIALGVQRQIGDC